MAEVLLFGATGYTGRKTAAALARRGVATVLAGRNAAKLEALATEVGAADVAVVSVGDTQGLARAAAGTRVLITCVGPFVELGQTAIDAALSAGVHYVDSTGEGEFVARLIARDAEARAAGVAVLPAFGFDEVPADVVATLACEGLERPDLTLTYAVPRTGSRGTVRSALGLVSQPAPFIDDGTERPVAMAERSRFSPLPEPLGLRRAVSAPLAYCRLAPLHLELNGLGTYVTIGGPELAAVRLGLPLLRLLPAAARRALIEAATAWLPEGPDDDELGRGRFTVMAEAARGGRRRFCWIQGADVYGLTAELLALAGELLSQDGFEAKGVLAPVQAAGLERLRAALEGFGCEVVTTEPAPL